MQKTVNLIYVLGISFSGSTLLGFLLGSVPEVVYLGELKESPALPIDKICSCGKHVEACNFWSKYLDSGLQSFGKPGKWKKLGKSINIILGVKEKQHQISQTADYQLLHSLEKDIHQTQPDVRYLVDSSKTIWRLAHLLTCEGINIHIVYIKRSFKNNVASFTKRNARDFWKGIFIYSFNHFLIKRFLKINNLPHSKVQYEAYCQQPEHILNELGKQWGISYDHLQAKLKHRSYHVRTGNSITRTQFGNGFTGIKKDDSPGKKTFSKFQNRILKILSKTDS